MSLPMHAHCSDRVGGRRVSKNRLGGTAARTSFLFACAAVFLMAFVLIRPASGQDAADVRRTLETFEVGENVFVRALAIDEGRNSLWVGTSVGALEIDLATHDVKNTFTRENGLANEYVFAVGVAPSGEVWFGTNAGGTSVYREGEFTTYFPMHGLADYWVYSFAFAEDGGVWIGTWDGASRYDPTTDGFTTYRDELINIWVYGIDIDSAGRIWLGTEGGVSMLDGDTWRSWTHEDGLGEANLQSLPPSDNTGLGTRTRHDLSVSVGSGESYNPGYVFDVRVDNQGRGVWFGTWGGGLSLLDDEGNWTSYSIEDGLPGNIVYSLAQEADGTLWLGTNQGASAYDGKEWITYRQGLEAPHVYAIAIENGGTVWLGTKGGVTRLAPHAAP